MNEEAVIVSGARTPIGSFRGQLRAHSATDLGGTAIAAAVQRAGISETAIDEIQRMEPNN